MSLVLVGLSHKSAPLEVREGLAVLPAAKIQERLKAAHIGEAVILSTCNRFELYLISNGGGPASLGPWALSMLQELAGASSLAEHYYSHEGAEAVNHLFSVASGLDSLVVGESEILGQVKDAYEAAKASGMTGKYFNVLFQRALYTGKKVRNDTAIAVGQTSVASVAVQLAESIFGDLKRSQVLILGAGNMAEVTARHLLSKKVPQISIANRTLERAKSLAEKFSAKAMPWEEFPKAIEHADILIASTGSDKPVVTSGMIREAAQHRNGRSLFIIDIAMPRDVEETVHQIEHVYLYRLEDLERVVAENMGNRSQELLHARGMVREKTLEFHAWEQSLASGSEISLKHAVRASEVGS